MLPELYIKIAGDSIVYDYCCYEQLLRHLRGSFDNTQLVIFVGICVTFLVFWTLVAMKYCEQPEPDKLVIIPEKLRQRYPLLYILKIFIYFENIKRLWLKSMRKYCKKGGLEFALG